jgi:HTH-type transcriptional regulator/antitoxin HigA
MLLIAREDDMATTVLDFTKPHVLRDEKEYEAAIEEIENLLDIDPQPGSADYEALDFLSVLVKAYEDRHHPIGPSTPQEIVSFMLSQKGMDRSDLYGIMGGKSRVSDFFNGVRRLSMGQLVALRRTLGIPADLLID